MGEIVAEISIMMNAGSDTTGIALNNALLMLLKHPPLFASVARGGGGILDGDEVVAFYDKVKHLPYIRACIDESLRMFPLVSFGLPRRTPSEGVAILGEFIPGDTSVSISAYVVHRNEGISSKPEQYRLERWLGDAGKEPQPYFVAFRTGARGCIGRNISYLEQTALLATLVHRYGFSLSSPDWEPVSYETINFSSGPMPLKLWRRPVKYIAR